MNDLAFRISCIKGTAAFFICPDGKIIFVRDNHISSIINNPERFGFNRRMLEACYKIHGETLYREGAARTEILLELVRNGWIRLRRYPNRYWSATLDTVSPCTMKRMRGWAEEIISGVGGIREEDLFMPVRMAPVSGGNVQWTNLEGLVSC